MEQGRTIAMAAVNKMIAMEQTRTLTLARFPPLGKMILHNVLCTHCAARQQDERAII